MAVTRTGVVWLVGEGVVLRGDGRRFAVLGRQPGDELQAVAESPTGDVWVAGRAKSVGAAGLALRWTAGNPAPQRFEGVAAGGLRALAFGPGQDLWAAGSRGAVARFDGRAWKLLQTGCTSRLTGVGVDGSGAVVVGGEGGALLRRGAPSTP